LFGIKKRRGGGGIAGGLDEPSPKPGGASGRPMFTRRVQQACANNLPREAIRSGAEDKKKEIAGRGGRRLTGTDQECVVRRGQRTGCVF